MSSTMNNERLWQSHDILLYLCRFVDGQELVLFAASCRFIYKTIVDRPDYWERQYKKIFSLAIGANKNGLCEVKESTLDVNQTKQEHLVAPIGTNVSNVNNEYALLASYLKSVSSFDATQWFYAYQRRRQIERNFMAGRFKKQIYQLPADGNIQMELADVNPWYTLVSDKRGYKTWSIQHNLFSKKNEYGGEEPGWKELAIPIPPALFDCSHVVFSASEQHQFVMAYVNIMTYNDVRLVDIGDPIVNINELKAQHIKESASKVFNTLDEHSTASATIAASNERKSSQRTAILVWPNAGSSLPNVIYLGHGYDNRGREEFSHFSDTCNEWALFCIYYAQYSYRRFDLINLDEGQWIEGVKLYNDETSSCIQFASHDKCQFLTCAIVHDVGAFDLASTFIANEDSQIAGNDNPLLYIQWKLLDAHKGWSKSKEILSGQITIPYWPDAIVGAGTYTEKMCLITVANPYYDSSSNCDDPFDTLLFFFVFGKDASNTSPQSLFDARDYGQLQPIDNSDQGYILWRRPIIENTITGLYSEKIIIVHSGKTIDVLDARNGDLLRSITVPFNVELTPFIGSLCNIFSRRYKKNWFIDMRTGRIYKPPACLTIRKTEDNNEAESLGLIEVSDLKASRKEKSWKSPEYRISNFSISRFGVNGSQIYETFIL
ncbi:hypothetical protein BDF19DRAFT_435903 [Syncephalis fuscata]|nr:hypothetical protein BDF19DRAFT_435903 [Syncephalis fuscata]